MTSQPAEPIILAQDVHKWYNNRFHVLKGVSLQIQRGEVVVIMGPSGSGKSTFIRTFNGLEAYQRGRIVIDGIELSHDMGSLEAIRREVIRARRGSSALEARAVRSHEELGLRDERKPPIRTGGSPPKRSCGMVGEVGRVDSWYFAPDDQAGRRR